MGDHEGLVAPVVELREEQVGGAGRLDAVVGQLALGNPLRTVGRRHHLAEVLHHVDARPAEEDGKHAEGQGGRGHVVGAARQTRGDRPVGDVRVVQVAQDDVLVAVVVLGGGAHLGPLPAEEGGDVGALDVARHGVAGTDRFDGLVPAARREGEGVVVDGPEVEGRAVAREVAGVRDGTGPVAAGHGQAHEERVGRERGMDVQVSEQDPARRRNTGIPRRHLLGAAALPCHVLGNRRGGRCARLARLPEDAASQELEDGQRQHEQDHGEDQEAADHPASFYRPSAASSGGPLSSTVFPSGSRMYMEGPSPWAPKRRATSPGATPWCSRCARSAPSSKAASCSAK